jgi:general secretion pathway protein F
MPSGFAYQAIAADGSLDRGRVDAEDAADAKRILATRGRFTLELGTAVTRQERREALSAADLALGLRILADLLDSGLPVARALHTFEELAPRAWKSALPHIRQSVREGKSLAAALAAAPLAIPPLVTGIAQAGEAGAGIGPAVRRAAELTEAAAEMQAAVRSALAYPAVVAVAGIGAITVLITVVLPRFALILADLGQTLPASTRLVLHGATMARAALMPSILVGGTLAALWAAWSRTAAGRVRWHGFLLQIPVLGQLRAGIATARMAHSLAALLDSGVTIATALTHAARATGDACIEARLVTARDQIASGQTLSHGLQASRAATITAIRLIRAGEESGRLTSMLAHAARIEQQRTDRVIRTAVRMLEPILLLTFAGLVALVASALLQAIYSVRPTV